MNAKRTRKSGTRRTSDGKKSAPKELKFNDRAAQAALGDDFWRVRITISSKDRLLFLTKGVTPPVPPPPISPKRLLAWAGRLFIA